MVLGVPEVVLGSLEVTMGCAWHTLSNLKWHAALLGVLEMVRLLDVVLRVLGPILGVLERVPVNDPVTWCSRMVITPKPDGSPRRVVDYTSLNKHAPRQTHPVTVRHKEQRTKNDEDEDEDKDIRHHT